MPIGETTPFINPEQKLPPVYGVVYLALLKQFPVLICHEGKKPADNFLDTSPLFEKSLGFSRKEWFEPDPYHFWISRMPEDYRDIVLFNSRTEPTAENPNIQIYPLKANNGELRVIRDTTSLSEDGGKVSVLEDITEYVQLVEQLTQLESDFENLPISVWFENYAQVKEIVDSLVAQTSMNEFVLKLEQNHDFVVDLAKKVRILKVNKATNQMHPELSRQEFVNGGGIDRFLDDNSYPVFIEQLIALAQGKTEYKSSKALKAISGEEEVWVNIEWKVIPGYEKDYKKVSVVVNNVTREVELSLKDSLTEIYNHKFIEERLKISYSDAKRNKNTDLSILMVDLDSFKQVNDNHGHLVGDKMLWATAQLIQSLIRGTDFVGRWGGDEFSIILTNTKPDGADNLAERIKLSAKILLPKFLALAIENPLLDKSGKESILQSIKEHIKSIPQPPENPLEYLRTEYQKAASDLPYGASLNIGIANMNPDIKDSAELILLADNNLYEAKNSNHSSTVP